MNNTIVRKNLLFQQAQEKLNEIFAKNESCIATLPFPDVVGYNKFVNLF